LHRTNHTTPLGALVSASAKWVNPASETAPHMNAPREGQEPALAMWSANVSSIETAPLEMERRSRRNRA